MAKAKVNKAAEVRAYMKIHPNAGTRDVAKALKKLKITAAYVSTVKSAMNTRKAQKTAKRGRPAKQSNDGNLAAVVAAATFIKECGGIDAANDALKAAAAVLDAGN